MSKKEKKKRSDKYEEKLSIDGTFEDVIKVSVKPYTMPEPEKKEERPTDKKNKKK